MGNDSSRLKGLVIDKNAVEANDFWTLYNAEQLPTTNDDGGIQMLSIFQGETVVNGQLWVTQGPMERAIKNFMIYRHPYILKYVTTWEQGGQKHLATERVRPLAAVLATHSDIQVCLGLRTILCSLIFLIEKAMARHLNISISSIYITDNGNWRLAGFEYVWKRKEVSKNLLNLANAYRYAEAIDPCETKEYNIETIEQYAFGMLCENILSKYTKNDTATPHVKEFRDYCAIHLKHKNAQMRPKLSAILLHPYFNHEFVLIHSFLFELPLKSVLEKQDFFTSLVDRLRYFNEDVVGAQLAADLLSRMVLLDPTAQLCVTPYVLRTKNSDYSAALFSNQTYTRYLMPHIRKMFRLRDAQIRLILLEYFMEYVRLLSKEDLHEFILPHLIAGMNDTNDVLVAKTMRCLADLIPILGSATVIGGNRIRIFSDGRPQAAVPDTTTHWVEPRSITPVIGRGVDCMMSDSPVPDNVDLSGSFNSFPQDQEISEQLEMPPRLSPDGGEDDNSPIVADGVAAIENENDVTSSGEHSFVVEPASIDVANTPPKLLIDTITTAVNDVSVARNYGQVNDDDDDDWPDWETDETHHLNDVQHKLATTSDGSVTLLPLDSMPSDISPAQKKVSLSSSSSYITLPSHISLPDSYRTTHPNESSSPAAAAPPSPQQPAKINDDLSALDIKVQKLPTPTHQQSTEYDFFKDMEPVIETKWNKLVMIIGDGNNTTAVSVANKTTNIEEDIQIDSSRFAAIATLNCEDASGSDAWRDDDDDTIGWNA